MVIGTSGLNVRESVEFLHCSSRTIIKYATRKTKDVEDSCFITIMAFVISSL